VAVETSLFIENRHMLDPNHPYRNPAVEWDRLTKAILDYGLHIVDPKYPAVGGFTWWKIALLSKSKPIITCAR